MKHAKYVFIQLIVYNFLMLVFYLWTVVFLCICIFRRSSKIAKEIMEHMEILR